MGFELFCITLIALFVGVAICFNGYRWFLILLPIFAFFFGFGLGLDTMQSLFGAGAIGTVIGWVVGFIVALIFAVLSYLFYFIGVALISGSLGYAIGVGLMGLVGFNPGTLSWLVGIILGIAVAFITFRFNIQKWVLIAVTAVYGAGIVISTFLMAFGMVKPVQFGVSAVRIAIGHSWFWLIGFLVLAILGFATQVSTNRTYTLKPYQNRI